MERLTLYESIAGHVHAVPTGDIDTALMRLAAYEDTGLTPEQIKELAHDTTGPLHRKISEWINAETAGRLVVLPCKVGDALYRTSPSGVVVHRVANVVYRGITGRWYIDTIPNLPYASEEFGKTVFLTREEAEKALEAMK